MRERTPRPWPDDVEPSPEELAAWLRDCSDPERIEIAERVLRHADEATRCLIENHATAVSRAARLSRLMAAVLAIDAADHASSSRDYGRGFADALRLVREAAS